MQAFCSMFSFDSLLSQSRSMGQAVPAVHLTFYRLAAVIRGMSEIGRYSGHSLLPSQPLYTPVSYAQLDVYKRQSINCICFFFQHVFNFCYVHFHITSYSKKYSMLTPKLSLIHIFLILHALLPRPVCNTP